MKRNGLHPMTTLFLCCLVAGCPFESQTDDGDEALLIELRWIPSYPAERRADVETGLLWTLSFLGAALPRDGPSPLSWRDDRLTLRLDRAGIDAALEPQWRRLLSALKAGSEYRDTGAVDIGRFVALTLCSPNHYYRLTGVGEGYDQARESHDFDPQPAAIVESSVALGNRLIELSERSGVPEMAFVAHEGRGSVADDSFLVLEHEVLDVMANGQLRFALYDTNGTLKPSASATLTAAGKPSKCLWCHETQLSKPFAARTSVRGYHSPAEFERQIEESARLLRAARAELRSRIDFDRDQDHTFAELLYLGFYEPSVDRLAREWRVPVERAEEMVAGLPSHPATEFEFLGARLYRRGAVDALAPYDVIAVPSDPREPSAYEPDLFQ